ncbi:30S ribosomal protein S20 [Patescibacteria group bacterium]|nr:30S ribosomal protein S20 [Patescibacteria group bacterium]
MPIKDSAKKSLRQDKARASRNLLRKKAMREIIKEMYEMLDEKKVSDAEKKLPEAYKAIDKAAKAGTIEKNTAARKKSRLIRAIAHAGSSK